MRYIPLTIFTVALMTASPAFAKSASKEENVGVGAGAVVGALAGGPIGFIVGAAIGAKVGDKMHKKSTTIDALTGSLDDSQRQVSALENDVLTLNLDVDNLSAELVRLREIDRPELIKLMQAGIAMDVLFRTDEHVLADTTGARLAELAGSLASKPEIRLQLDGFADERGNEDYNLKLSEKRVLFVRDQLISAGVDPTRIRISAHGEAPAQDDSTDSYALERRVSLKLFIENSQPFASSP